MNSACPISNGKDVSVFLQMLFSLGLIDWVLLRYLNIICFFCIFTCCSIKMNYFCAPVPASKYILLINRGLTILFNI